MSERDELKPCPFCGGKAYFERMGTRRQSCIVECGSCGVRHESGDEGGMSGQSWNDRHEPESAAPRATVEPAAVPEDERVQFDAFKRGERRAANALMDCAREVEYWRNRAHAAPQPAVPVPALTDEQIREIAAQYTTREYGDDCVSENVDVVAFARAILAAPQPSPEKATRQTYQD